MQIKVAEEKRTGTALNAELISFGALLHDVGDRKYALPGVLPLLHSIIIH
jgi:hypothetical protein